MCNQLTPEQSNLEERIAGLDLRLMTEESATALATELAPYAAGLSNAPFCEDGTIEEQRHVLEHMFASIARSIGRVSSVEHERLNDELVALEPTLSPDAFEAKQEESQTVFDRFQYDLRMGETKLMSALVAATDPVDMADLFDVHAMTRVQMVMSQHKRRLQETLMGGLGSMLRGEEEEAEESVQVH